MYPTREIIIYSLGDRPLRAVQAIESPREMWAKLFERYPSSTQANQINPLTAVLNKIIQNPKEIIDHISEFEGLFNRIEAMECTLDSQLETALLIVSVVNTR